MINHGRTTRKGGFRTMPFIIVNESFEKIASYGLAPNMVFYLREGYHLETAAATSTLLLWSALSNALAIFGAFFADSYLGRFRAIAIGSFSSLLGTAVLWLTAMIPEMKPSPCSQSGTECRTANTGQLALLFSSLGLISVGAGFIRPCSIAFGADQLGSSHGRILDSYFNWYYATVGVSSILALTVIVYIQDNFGWVIGFGFPAILMVLSVVIFLLGSSIYVKVRPSKSLFTGFVQVLVVAFKNRKLDLSQINFDQNYPGRDTKFPTPTDDLRCLNGACIVRNGERDLNRDGSISNPWNVCSVEQVESLKALLRVIPMWSTSMIMLLCLSQTSFALLQAKTMNRRIAGNFELPAGSFTLFLVVALTVWVVFYERIMLPLLAKYASLPRGLSPVVRMGMGLVLTFLAMVVAAIIESTRRQSAIEEGLVSRPNTTIIMSAMWLVPQFVLLGLAEGLFGIGLIEFFYAEFPRSMSSIAVAFYTLAMALASLMGSLLVDVVNGLSGGEGKRSWLANNINEGHLDYYYWVCSSLGLLNIVYFLLCCRVYGSSEKNKARACEEEEEIVYRSLPSP